MPTLFQQSPENIHTQKETSPPSGAAHRHHKAWNEPFGCPAPYVEWALLESRATGYGYDTTSATARTSIGGWPPHAGETQTARDRKTETGHEAQSEKRMRNRDGRKGTQRDTDSRGHGRVAAPNGPNQRKRTAGDLQGGLIGGVTPFPCANTLHRSAPKIQCVGVTPFPADVAGVCRIGPAPARSGTTAPSQINPSCLAFSSGPATFSS